MALSKIRRNVNLLLDQFAPVETEGWGKVTTDEFAHMLKQQFGPDLVRLIEEGESQKREAGAMLCQSSDGTLLLNQKCWGTRRTVTIHDCQRSLRSVGSFHVHLFGSDVFSPADLGVAADTEQFSCLGYMKNGVPMLKVISTHKYRVLPVVIRKQLRRGLAEADYDIERAAQQTNASQALALSNRAHSTLRDIERVFSAYEVAL